MIPTPITAVLKGALTGFIFMYLLHISKKSRIQILHLNPAMATYAESRVPGVAIASYSVG